MLSTTSRLTSVIAVALLCTAGVARGQGNGAGANAGTRKGAVVGTSGPGVIGNLPGSRLSLLDTRFVVATALGGMREIHTAHLAQRQATTDGIRQFAARMIRDHEQAKQELATLAASKGITLPTMPDLRDVEPAAPGTGDNGAGQNGLQRQNGNSGLNRNPGQNGIQGQNVVLDTDPDVPGEAGANFGAWMTMAEPLGLRHILQQNREEMRVLSSLSGSMFDQAYIGGQVKAHASTVAAFELQARNSQDPDLRAFASRMLPILQDHYRMARQLVGLGTETAAIGATGIVGTNTSLQTDINNGANGNGTLNGNGGNGNGSATNGNGMNGASNGNGTAMGSTNNGRGNSRVAGYRRTRRRAY